LNGLLYISIRLTTSDTIYDQKWASWPIVWNIAGVVYILPSTKQPSSLISHMGDSRLHGTNIWNIFIYPGIPMVCCASIHRFNSFSPLSSVDDLKVITTRQIEFMTLVLWDISTGWPYQSENMAIDPFYMKVSISGSYTVDSI
jgi:hypothetical protein